MECFVVEYLNCIDKLDFKASLNQTCWPCLFGAIICDSEIWWQMIWFEVILNLDIDSGVSSERLNADDDFFCVGFGGYSCRICLYVWSTKCPLIQYFSCKENVYMIKSVHIWQCLGCIVMYQMSFIVYMVTCSINLFPFAWSIIIIMFCQVTSDGPVEY